MKGSSIIFLVLLCTNLAMAQVKIGDNPQILDPTSLLELESDSKVLVISRMSEAEILALSPLQGAVVYNTDASCIFYYDGTDWNNLCDGGNTGSISWGAITGNLTDQTDISAEFQNYVDLTTAQSIAGEKTLTEKLTVDTGTPTNQIAEFLGRVKGENGTEPEDFVTRAQLDAFGGGGGGSAWGSITGDLALQTDLAAEFQNYVDLTTAQSIAGEKTFTEKFTVDTGAPTDQIAEFLGRVKGEDGTEPEDFVTRAQLDAIGGAGGGGAGTWGTITGTLTDQTDLAAEFQNYVNLTTAQSIAGEKTLTEKFTVDTGAPNNQIAEFLGRVKGEDGTEPEDFVTRAQLDAIGGGGGGAGTWGSITGTLTDQTDLAAEFQNYVDLTTAQSIAGEKTLTEKFTVDTGATTDQVAEFLGRVKGENGTADEDFVTRQQLDALNETGATGTEGSIFFAGADTGLTENNAELFWDNDINQLRVGSNRSPNQNGSTNSTLSVQGSISTRVTFGETVLDETHHTVIINDTNLNAAEIVLPDPRTCVGRIYIIKRRPTITITFQGVYIDANYDTTSEMGDITILHLQSNGFQWEQIN